MLKRAFLCVVIVGLAALEHFTIPYSQPVLVVIPAKAGIQALGRWMPDHVRHDESGTATA